MKSPRLVPLIDRAGLAGAEREALEREVAPHRTLEDVLRASHARTPRAEVVDVVTQDEFTHDVVVAHPGGWFLVYDTS